MANLIQKLTGFMKGNKKNDCCGVQIIEVKEESSCCAAQTANACC